MKAIDRAGSEPRSFTHGGDEVGVIIRLPDLDPPDLEAGSVVCGEPCAWPQLCRDCYASASGEAMLWLRDLAERLMWMDVVITERSDEALGGVPR